MLLALDWAWAGDAISPKIVEAKLDAHATDEVGIRITRKVSGKKNVIFIAISFNRWSRFSPLLYSNGFNLKCYKEFVRASHSEGRAPASPHFTGPPTVHGSAGVTRVR